MVVSKVTPKGAKKGRNGASGPKKSQNDLQHGLLFLPFWLRPTVPDCSKNGPEAQGYPPNAQYLIFHNFYRFYKNLVSLVPLLLPAWKDLLLSVLSLSRTLARRYTGLPAQ